jgi:adenylosuccinate lyase
MIERYTLPEMGRIWSEESKVSIWLRIEVLLCEALAREGRIPEETATAVRKKARFDLDRVRELEGVTHHDVAAFVMNVGESVGEAARYVHFGLTSSDVVDTALAVQLKQSAERIVERLRALSALLRKRSLEFQHTPCVGRTHGVHAEPTTFGFKLLLWHAETERNVRRMEAALDTVSVGKISGAVGTHAHLGPGIEEFICRELGLRPAPVSTQVVQRDRHAEYLGTLALVASSLEKMATEVRGLQRTEIREVEEYFAAGQKGSSSMPHKRNPVLCERICGLSRVMRGYAATALQNVALWHERDISHSSAERVVLADGSILADYMLHLFSGVVEKLVVYPERMMENLDKTGGLPFSQTLLLALVNKGARREEAYRIVQSTAMRALDEGREFAVLVRGSEEVTRFLGPEEIDRVFSLEVHLRNVDAVFARVLGGGR